VTTAEAVASVDRLDRGAATGHEIADDCVRTRDRCADEIGIVVDAAGVERVVLIALTTLS